MVKSFTPAPGTSYSIFPNYHFSIYSQIAFFNKLHSPGVLVSRSLEVGPTNGGGDESFLSASAASLYLRERWVPGMCPQTHTHTHTHAARAPLQFARNDLSCVIYTRLPPVKGWMCSFNFFLFSIGFIYFLSALLLCLLRQSAFFFPSLPPAFFFLSLYALRTLLL